MMYGYKRWKLIKQLKKCSSLENQMQLLFYIDLCKTKLEKTNK